MRTVLLNTLEWFGDANDRQRLLADKQKRLKVGKGNRHRHHGDYSLCIAVAAAACIHTGLSRNVFKLIFVRENAWTARHQTISDHSFFPTIHIYLSSISLLSVYVCPRLFVC